MLRHFRRQAIAITASFLTLGLLVQLSSAGGHRRCARQTDGIPKYDYQSNEIRQRATVSSHVKTAVAGKPNEKLFQPFEEPLVVGDCSLTQIRLLVDSQGNYLLSYRAANSAPSLDLAPPPSAVKAKAATAKANEAKPILPVRHHRFQITVRLYSGPEVSDQRERTRAGGVALAQFTLPEFHVSAASDLVRLSESNSAAIRTHFAAATQAEFELEIDPSVTIPARTSRP
jgi:hypothetical protein